MALRLFFALALMMLAAPAYAQTSAVKTETVPVETVAETTPAPAPVIEASNIVGTLMEAEGSVSLLVAGAESKALKTNDPIRMNDVIETGAGARAFILLIDDTELTLGENAQLTIDEYIFDEEDTSANKGRYSVLRGAFLYTSGLLAKKENPDVVVNTPHGSIGIRGTTFWGGDIDGEYGVLVTEGRVSVQTERGRIFVDKGKGTSLRAKTSIPSRPEVWATEKTDRAVQTIAIKNAAGLRERVGKRMDAQKEARQKYRQFMKQRQQEKGLGVDPRAPVKRIDYAPRPLEQKTPQKGMPKKADVTNESLNKPFVKETKVEPLLGAKPTNSHAPIPAPAPAAAATATAQTPKTAAPAADLLKPIDEKATTSGAPKVDLPALGENEAQTNELREQQHIQRRQQPMKRRQRSLDAPAGKAPSESKANKAF